MTLTPELAARVVDGRTVVDELPRRLGVLPAEVDLVAQHLLGDVETLLGGGPYTSSAPRSTAQNMEDQPDGQATKQGKKKQP